MYFAVFILFGWHNVTKKKREGRRVGRRGVAVRGRGEGEGLAREGEGEAVSEPTAFENQA